MKHEDFEKLIGQVLDNSGDGRASNTDLLQQIRDEHAAQTEQVKTVLAENEKLQATIKDLVEANSKLFAERGYDAGGDDNDENDDDLGDTITTDDLFKPKQ